MPKATTHLGIRTSSRCVCARCPTSWLSGSTSGIFQRSHRTGGTVGGYLSRDGGRSRWGFIRGQLGPTADHSFEFICRFPQDGETLALEGVYDADRDYLLLFVPYNEGRIGVGNVITGCPPPDGEGVCATYDQSVYTSPTFGMYGYDGVKTRKPYKIR